MRRSFVPVLTLIVMIAAVLTACTSAGSASPAGPPRSAPPTPADASTTRVAGVATAGPVCPVERPGDSACAPRPVARATLIVTRGASEVARVTTGADGRFALDLPAGTYTLVPQPVEGLLGTAKQISFSVAAPGGPTPAPLDVSYDTGIR